MTDQSEVEKLTREIQHKFTTVVMGDGQEELNTEWEDLARWHIREKEIAVLEALINYHNCDICAYHDCSKIKKFKSRLAELRKGFSQGGK